MLTKAELSHLRSLRQKKHREESGHFVVEGEKVMAELLSAGFAFETIYATEDWKAPRSLKADVRTITSDEMVRASHYPTPSTVLGVGRLHRATLDPCSLNRGLTLALDGVQDPGNVGTVIRIADWFGLARVLLSPDCADLFHQKTIDASMGSFARVATHTVDLAASLRDLRVPVLGCDLVGSDVHTLAPTRDAVVVIGSEGRGLSPAVKALVTGAITIPRFGGAESLNAAIAAAIVCDNLRRGQKP